MQPQQSAARTALDITSVARASWNTWGYNRARWGYNASETQLSTANVAGLKLKWAAPVTTHFIDTQPIVPAVTHNVYVADEHGALFAINAATGALVWNVQLGNTTAPLCSGSGTGISYGITSDPVFDPKTNRLYVLDGAGVLWAIDATTGAQATGFPPLQAFTNPQVEHAWSALQLTADGSTLFYSVASHCDAGDYNGSVDAVNTATEAVTAFSTVTEPSQYYGNGVWGWGSPSIDPDNGNLYAGVGNSQGSLGEDAPLSDSVLELTQAMTFVADEQPEIPGPSGDLDIGTTPVPYDDGGGKCAAFSRKDGYFFIVKRHALANNVYGTKLDLKSTFSTPAYDPVTHALYVSAPGGLVKVAIGANCTGTVAWTSKFAEASFQIPVIANGVVYAAGGDKLYALDANSGKILWNSGTTVNEGIKAAPSVVNGVVYAASWNGSVYAFSL